MRTDQAHAEPPVLTAVLVGAVTSAQLVASRAIRDGFFLTHFEAIELPKMVITSAIFSLIVVLTSSHLLRAVAPARSMPWFFCASAMLFALESALASQQPEIVAVMLYLHVLSLGLLVASGYWSVLSERFDPYSAKRFIGRIGGGATLGGALGGAIAWWGASALAVHWLLVGLSVANFVAAAGVWQLGQGSKPRPRRSAPADSGLQILKNTPYLRHLALLVALGAFCQACYDYILKSTVAETFNSGSELVSFFALFYMGLNICTFLTQHLLTRYSLEKYGLSATVGSLPGAGVLLGLLGLISPGLASATTMRGGVGVVENSMFRSGYELLYTPVLPEKKRPTKTIIDVGGEMLGATAGGGLVYIVLAVLPGISNTVLVLAGMMAGLGGLLVTRRIRLGYIKSLADSLEADNIDLELAAFGDGRNMPLASVVTALQSDSRTRRRIPAGSKPLKRAELAASIVARQERKAGYTDQQVIRKPLILPVEDELSEAAADAIDSAILSLRSANSHRIRQVLQAYNPLPAELVSHVIPLLDSVSQGESVAQALSLVAPRHLGALLDTALLSSTPVEIRRRICAILANVPNQRCVEGLLALLQESDIELRLRATSTLLEIRRKNDRLVISRRRIFDAATAEAQHCRQLWLARRAVHHRISNTPALESPQGQRVIQGVTYIGALLLAVLDPQPTGLAIRALANPNPAHRGTGLEYLQNVLPVTLLRELLPLMEDRELALGTVRPRKGILAELTAQRDSDEYQLVALRRRVDALRNTPGTEK